MPLDLTDMSNDVFDDWLRDLVSLTIPVDVPPADERAGQREKGLMNVSAALVADPQPAKPVKPPEGSFDNPTPAAKPFA